MLWPLLTTASSFLLDVAEKRIRDAALCGWKQPDKLKRCAELFANYYLTEIINVLGAFFEDKSLMEIKVSCILLTVYCSLCSLCGISLFVIVIVIAIIFIIVFIIIMIIIIYHFYYLFLFV